MKSSISQRSITIVLCAALLLLQSCRVYRSKTITLDEAVKSESRVKIKTTNNKTLRFQKIVFENGEYLGVKNKYNGYEHTPLTEEMIQRIKPQNKTVSAILTGTLAAFIVSFVLVDAALGSFGTGLFGG